MTVASCSDETLGDNANNGDNDAVVHFEINDAQEEILSRGGVLTRAANGSSQSQQELMGRKLEAQNAAGLDVCLIETTVEGVNPVKVDAGTRANIVNRMSLGDFSTTGIRGTAVSNINENWFNSAKTKNSGELYTPIRWSWYKPFGRFYAAYPESNIAYPDASGNVTVEFTTNPDVRQQVDFMTACSGDVQYATRFQAPKTSLNFRHALTAIRFAVGQNLSFDKTIKEITLKNVLLKSKYIISNKYDGTGAQWVSTGYNTRGDVKLDNLNYRTNENPNSIIRDVTKYPAGGRFENLKDNYTFYLIPQELTNKVTAVITFSDNTSISIPLKGSWEQGTTRTYKLSEKTSTWTYTLEATSPEAVAYNRTTSGNYGITSYRTAPDGTKKPIAWKITGYSEDNGATWTMNKPAWLRLLTKESGNGGTAAEQGVASLSNDVIDLAAKRNKELQDATPLGSAANPYNLSNNTGADAVQNTANCYVISAPGYYSIPLVYGNAIKNGATNASAYKSSAPVTNVTFGSPATTKDVILHTLVAHDGSPISDPWIEKTNNKAFNGINGAQVVWADGANLVTLPAAPIYRDASGNAFVKFEVTKANLKSGNAVIAVKKGNTILWSWHLWFAPKNDGVEKNEGSANMYQWGRKDPFPGTNTILGQGSIKQNAGDQIYMQNIIQNPGFFYTTGTNGAGVINANAGLTKYYYFYNLWSINNRTASNPNQVNNTPVVKTIYDPSPVGFSVPSNAAFTGFTANGLNEGTMNVNGTDVQAAYNANYGHLFWTNSSKTATVRFPAFGYRDSKYGAWFYGRTIGDYWSADPNDVNNGCVMGIQVDKVYPLYRNIRTYGFAVRPVAE